MSGPIDPAILLRELSRTEASHAGLAGGLGQANAERAVLDGINEFARNNPDVLRPMSTNNSTLGGFFRRAAGAIDDAARAGLRMVGVEANADLMSRFARATGAAALVVAVSGPAISYFGTYRDKEDIAQQALSSGAISQKTYDQYMKVMKLHVAADVDQTGRLGRSLEKRDWFVTFDEFARDHAAELARTPGLREKLDPDAGPGPFVKENNFPGTMPRTMNPDKYYEEKDPLDLLLKEKKVPPETIEKIQEALREHKARGRRPEEITAFIEKSLGVATNAWKELLEVVGEAYGDIEKPQAPVATQRPPVP